MRLNIMANSFIFGRTNRDNAPWIFFINLAKQERPTCVWISQQTILFFNTKIVELRPELFCKTCRQKTFKMRLNFTGNRFVSGHTYRGIAPTTFSVNIGGIELAESVWISRQTALFLDAQTFSVKFAGRELPKCVWAPRQTASFLDA